MKVTFTHSFERSLKKCSERDRALKAVDRFLQAIGDQVKPEGLGLKKLRNDLWEIRAGLKGRVLFMLNPGEIRFLLVGNHDEIKDYLKES